MKRLFKLFLFMGVVTLAGCGQEQATETQETSMDEVKEVTRDILGNNAFLYYKDYDEAIDFYHNKLGFKNVFEFPGFAMILQFSPTTFITVVNDDGSGRGMHSADEPKTIAIALLTDDIPSWYEYAVEQELGVGNPPRPIGERPYTGFLVDDPGGYVLEFEQFLEHEENTKLLPILADLENMYVDPEQESTRPAELAFKGGIYWLYHNDRERAEKFYTEAFGIEKLVTQKFSDIFTSSPTGFLGLVDGNGPGIHQATQDKAVNVGFMVSDAQAWWDHLETVEGFTFRHEELYHESDSNDVELIDIVIGYDPENYFIEIDEFLENDANKALREALGQ